MARISRPILFFSTLTSLFLFCSAQSCLKYKFAGNKSFTSCNDLPYLKSFIHYTYNPSKGALQIAYRHTDISQSKWVSWAINLESTGMIGSQALVAYQQADGSMKALTTRLYSYRAIMNQAELTFNVSDLSATYANNEIVIFATVQLPNNSTTLNQVWQDGPMSSYMPAAHDTSGPNMLAMETLNVLSGEVNRTTAAANAGDRKRNLHAVLNVASWGLMMPIGVMIARYVKVFESADPAWFYLHVTCQTSAYIIGVIGWILGVQLGNERHGVQHRSHRILGIVLFCLATLQVFALLLRPKKDHKYRSYWNVYHHLVGNSVIFIAFINILIGFRIVDKSHNWMIEYMGTIFVLGVISIFLEAYTCNIIQRRRQQIIGTVKLPHSQQGKSESHGYEGRDRFGV